MITITCRICDSYEIKKNGHTKSGQQKYHCYSCGFYGTLYTKENEKKIKHNLIEKLHLERPILELDEIWSYVGSKTNKVWIWLALERQTRRIVGLAFGDRSEKTCRKLWKSFPADYRKRAIMYTDMILKLK